MEILIATQPVVTAPAPVWLEAIDVNDLGVPGGPEPGRVYDPSFHEITYIWTVMGAPLAPYSAPENMVAGWNNPNIAYGKRAAFCFPEPGTYTILLEALDPSGSTATARTTISVASADSLYPGANTIVYAGDGDFTGAPAGARQISNLSTLGRAIQAARAKTRVLFKRGETILNVNVSTGRGRIDHLGAWGRGAPPTLRPKPFDTSNMITWHGSGPETQITIEGLKVQGYWDPDTETGSLGGGSPFQWRRKKTSAKILLYDVEITNCDAEQLSANAAPCDILVANCVFKDWQQYGCFCDRNQMGKYAFIGSRFTQSPKALNGGPKNGLSNNHGPIRITRCRWIVGDICDMFSNAGWSGSYDAQPCLRIGTHQKENTGIFLYWGRSVMENGYQIINVEGENTSAEDNPGNFVFDKLLLIGTARQRATMISCHKGGATFRNMLLFQPDVLGYSTGPHQFFEFKANNPRATNNDEPIKVYNVTAISLLSPVNENEGPMALVGDTGTFTDVTIENNVLYAPNSALPVTETGPLDMITPIQGVTPRYSGVQYNYAHTRGAFEATVISGASFDIPYTSILIVDHNGEGPNVETDQDYWQKTQEIDTLHALSIRGEGVFYAENDEFTVVFGPSNVTILNTSGASWPSGSEWALSLDRKSRLKDELQLQVQYANPRFVPSARPIGDSPALGGADLGLRSYDDLYGTVRPDPASKGAIEP